MTAADVLAKLSDDTRISIVVGSGDLTVGEVRAALAGASEPVYITTEQAAAMFSRSPRWWADQAPDIDGAYRDRVWRLPVEGCRDHLAALRTRKRTRRVPWGKTPR